MVASFAAQRLRQWQHPLMASLRALARLMMQPGVKGLRGPGQSNILVDIMRKVEGSYCAVIQGLSPNADIPAHADNDLPRPYATVSYSVSPSMKGKRKYTEQIVAASEAEHYAKMTPEIGVQVQIIGDDLIVTNPKLQKSIEDVRMSKRIGWGIMATYRSVETKDTFICKSFIKRSTEWVHFAAFNPFRNRNYNNRNRVAPVVALVVAHVDISSPEGCLLGVKDVRKKLLASREVKDQDLHIEYVAKDEDACYQVCNHKIEIDLSDFCDKKSESACGDLTISGEEGSTRLFYILLKDAIDASLEVKFQTKTPGRKVRGYVLGYYGDDFLIECQCPPSIKYHYMSLLFLPNHDLDVGAIQLIKSLLAVPPKGSLVITAYLEDVKSGKVIMKNSCKFKSQPSGSSLGTISGTDCQFLLTYQGTNLHHPFEFDLMNAKDMDNIIRVLHVFYLASGLKINIHKSNIYGIGVNKDEVLSMASNAGCIAGDIPFNYFGLPIGSNMKSIASWKTLVDRFHMRLSSWKVNLLSNGSSDSYQAVALSISRFWKDIWGMLDSSFTRIDQNILPTLAHATTWDKSIPRKVNVFMWRLSLDRLPHRLNLSSREGVIFLFFKLLHGILSMIGSYSGYHLKRKNTGSMLILLRDSLVALEIPKYASRLTLKPFEKSDSIR
ncbi:arginine--tRNA ligase, chloroplastic/mitochondrial [Tanacetum coccineum]